MSRLLPWRKPGEPFTTSARNAIIPPDPRLAEAVPGRFPLVDAIRAIAALGVFGYHVSIEYGWTGRWADFGLTLAFGVPIFFVISGFLMYRPFARAGLSGVPRPRLGRYARSRILRIVPAFWVALTFILLFGDQVFETKDLPYLYGFAQVYQEHTVSTGIGPAWSLGSEIVYYALVPVVAILLAMVAPAAWRSSLRAQVGGIVALFVLSAGLMYLAVDTEDRRFAFNLWPDWNLDLFVAGMAVAVWSAHSQVTGRVDRVARSVARHAGLWWFGALVTLVLAIWVRGLEGTAWNYVAINVLGGICGVLVLLPAIWGSASEGFLRRRVLSNPALLSIGVVSYGFYLWHHQIIGTLFDHRDKLDMLGTTPADVVLTVAGVVLALVAAIASWLFVEQFALSLKGKPTVKVDGKEVPVGSGSS